MGDPMSGERKSGSPEQTEIVRVVSQSNPGFIFLKPGTVEPLMGSTLDIPVGPLKRKHFVGAEAGSAGEKIYGEIVGGFRIFFVLIGRLHEHGCALGVREADLLAVHIKSRDRACFNTSSVFIDGLCDPKLRGKKIRDAIQTYLSGCREGWVGSFSRS